MERLDPTPTPGEERPPSEDRRARQAGARSRSAHLQAAVVVAAAVVYALVLSFFSLRAHQGLQTQMNDLGNADQVLWAAADGDWTMT